MLQLSIIGNLGANAELRSYNGQEFITFRVAHTERYTDAQGQTREQTTWVDCTKNGSNSELLKYLTKGTKVYVTGRPAFRIFDSAKYHSKMVGISLFANQIELCGQQNRDECPDELYDDEGVAHHVFKFYSVSDQDQAVFGKVLKDKNLNAYTVNNQGFILPPSAAADTQG